MPDSNWQVEKRKILTRLSIAIYKMTDEQLIALLHLFKDFELKAPPRIFPMDGSPPATINDSRDRHLLIARFFLLINQLTEADLLRFMNRYEEKRFAMLREYSRVACNIHVDMAVDGRAVKCFATDISAGGMFVESCETFSMGQPVALCFSLADARLPLKLKGRVIRLEHDGVGINYEALTAYQLDILKQLINRLRHSAGPPPRSR